MQINCEGRFTKILQKKYCQNRTKHAIHMLTTGAIVLMPYPTQMQLQLYLDLVCTNMGYFYSQLMHMLNECLYKFEY